MSAPEPLSATAVKMRSPKQQSVVEVIAGGIGGESIIIVMGGSLEVSSSDEKSVEKVGGGSGGMSGIVSTIVTVAMLGDGGRYARGYVGRGAECTAIGEDGVVGRAGGGKYARGYVGRACCTSGEEDDCDDRWKGEKE